MFLMVVLAAGCLTIIVTGLAVFDMQPAPAEAEVWLDAALAWICLGGLAFALAGVLMCCLGSFLGSLLVRAARAILLLSLTTPCSALPWRVWTDLRPPRFLS